MYYLANVQIPVKIMFDFPMQCMAKVIHYRGQQNSFWIPLCFLIKKKFCRRENWLWYQIKKCGKLLHMLKQKFYDKSLPFWDNTLITIITRIIYCQKYQTPARGIIFCQNSGSPDPGETFSIILLMKCCPILSLGHCICKHQKLDPCSKFSINSRSCFNAKAYLKILIER